MDFMREPSKLFRELLDMEKDFKYNLSLLKIREEEIERCNVANRMLQETVKSSLSEIERLNTRIFDLEGALRRSEQLQVQQNEISQRKIDKLTEDIAELIRKHRLNMEDYQRQMQKKEKEMADRHAAVLYEKKLSYKQCIELLEKKLIQENKHYEKVKSELQILVTENMTIRNKLRTTESHYITKTAFYESELNTTQSSNANLNSENEFLRQELQKLRQESAKINEQNEELKREVEGRTQKNQKLISDEIKIKLENKGLHEVLDKHACRIEGLIAENGRLAKDKCILAAELEKAKENQIASTISCNIPEHVGLQDILKQNEILRELVKSMKREKQHLNTENKENIMMVDNRLGNLEDLLNKLKRNQNNNNIA